MRKKDWWLVAASIVFIVVQVWLDLRLPDYMKLTPSSTNGGAPV